MKKLLLGTTVAVFAAVTLTAGIASARNHVDGSDCRAAPTFEMLDTNSDGAITAAELGAKAMEKFNQRDTNGDELLDASEILAAGQARMEARRGDREPREGSELRAEQRAEMAALRIEHLIERQDENGDGMLSAEEMKPDNAVDRFGNADADGNGEISQSEFETALGGRGETGQGKKGPRNHRGCESG